MLKVLRCLIGLLCLAQVGLANAALNIEIIGAGAQQIPVVVVPFAGDDRLAQVINEVVSSDLQRSGLFRLVDPEGKTPHEPAEVYYPDWQVRGAEAMTIG